MKSNILDFDLTCILNNGDIDLTSTKEYSAENLEYLRLRSSPKAYLFSYSGQRR